MNRENIQMQLDELRGGNAALGTLVVCLAHALPEPLKAKMFSDFDIAREAVRTTMLNDAAWTDTMLEGFDQQCGAIDQTRLPT